MPKYQLSIRRSAERDIRGLPPEIQARVKAAIERLKDDPRPPGVRKLVSDFRWRLRVGNYRILYQVDDNNRVVTIDRVRHRREVYK